MDGKTYFGRVALGRLAIVGICHRLSLDRGSHEARHRREMYEETEGDRGTLTALRASFMDNPELGIVINI